VDFRPVAQQLTRLGVDGKWPESNSHPTNSFGIP
jgi:hypothetical protein